MYRGVDINFEPIGQWTGEPAKDRRRSQFKSGFEDTMRLLADELYQLSAKRVVVQIDADRSQIRRDGLLRADARARPSVIVSFESKYGPVSYPCDTFDHWQDNLRAVALALEALRKIDRYGVSNRGQQYRGWQALPAPSRPDFKNEAEARAFISSLLGHDVYWGERGNVEKALRFAEQKTHPDRGGNGDEFKRVQAARELLLA